MWNSSLYLNEAAHQIISRLKNREHDELISERIMKIGWKIRKLMDFKITENADMEAAISVS